MIVLCRHGATDANTAAAFLSKDDPALNALGRAQSERARDALREVRFGAALCSPMLRCRQTLGIVAPSVPARIDPALREVDFGNWDGKTLPWIEANDPEGLARRRFDPVNFRPQGGESFADVAGRLQTLAREARDRATGSGLLIVAHRGTLGVLERLLRGIPLDERDVAPMDPGEYRILT